VKALGIGLGLALVALQAGAQEKDRTTELLGKIGTRPAFMVLNAAKQADGSWQVTGEYTALPKHYRRYLEGERSARLGVMHLKEGDTPILWARASAATLQGVWSEGWFRGTRFGPGGQERERFEFSEEFPSMNRYTAAVRCEASDGGDGVLLAYAFDNGALKPGSFEWQSGAAPSGPYCSIGAREPVEQVPFRGGLRLRFRGRCSVTLRDLGEFVRVSAENCNELCGARARLEPLLVDGQGGCSVMKPVER